MVRACVGPNGGYASGSLFSYRYRCLGGIMVTDADQLLDLISEAGSGYHFFGKGAERAVIRTMDS